MRGGKKATNLTKGELAKGNEWTKVTVTNDSRQTFAGRCAEVTVWVGRDQRGRLEINLGIPKPPKKNPKNPPKPPPQKKKSGLKEKA